MADPDSDPAMEKECLAAIFLEQFASLPDVWGRPSYSLCILPHLGDSDNNHCSMTIVVTYLDSLVPNVRIASHEGLSDEQFAVVGTLLVVTLSELCKSRDVRHEPIIYDLTVVLQEYLADDAVNRPVLSFAEAAVAREAAAEAARYEEEQVRIRQYEEEAAHEEQLIKAEYNKKRGQAQKAKQSRDRARKRGSASHRASDAEQTQQTSPLWPSSTTRQGQGGRAPPSPPRASLPPRAEARGGRTPPKRGGGGGGGGDGGGGRFVSAAGDAADNVPLSRQESEGTTGTRGTSGSSSWGEEADLSFGGFGSGEQFREGAFALASGEQKDGRDGRQGRDGRDGRDGNDGGEGGGGGGAALGDKPELAAALTLGSGTEVAVASTSRFKSDFEEIGTLGRGGFGEVVKARNRLDGLVYAIKKVKMDTDSQMNQKIRREVTTLSRLYHPHIVRYV